MRQRGLEGLEMIAVSVSETVSDSVSGSDSVAASGSDKVREQKVASGPFSRVGNGLGLGDGPGLGEQHGSSGVGRAITPRLAVILSPA